MSNVMNKLEMDVRRESYPSSENPGTDNQETIKILAKTLIEEGLSEERAIQVVSEIIVCLTGGYQLNNRHRNLCQSQ